MSVLVFECKPVRINRLEPRLLKPVCGLTLGPVENTDAIKGRVRVIINGLKPLERHLEISLKGETKQVELEYEKLEKHCFSCLSLSTSRLGITQVRTLDRIAESRRRADNRKISRFSPYERSQGDNNNVGRAAPSHQRSSHQRNDYHNRYDGRRDERSGGRRSANPTAKTYWRPISSEDNGRQALSIQSQISHTPSPKPQREPMGTGNNLQINSPRTPGATSVPSGERRSALERISGVPDRVPLLQNGVANSDSGRLQEVDIQYLEDTLPYQTPPDQMRPSTSKAVAPTGIQIHVTAEGTSPIRSLSEDRSLAPPEAHELLVPPGCQHRNVSSGAPLKGLM
ncbi:hypothetical protein DY000_02054190 [Brassica cretica]|uniref:Zinc knuckle CX2CX4HX4C domain-containing protein n=1 Tax=Brassica cretica TaxID=69181 RepID=A0ABQ7A8R9_BRACR|nr:hypothetical protein DY000_02054190 [Brassica cretica]